MLCRFERTGETNHLRCSRCGFAGEFAYAPEQVRRPCDVIDLQTESASTLQRGTLCRHIGAEFGTKECVGCRGRVRIKQFRCHHPAHNTTTLADCSSCADFAPNTVLPNERKRMLIRFPHGFGDAVQFTIVLRHLQARFPEWRVSVAVKPGLDALFTGLAAEVLPLDTPSDGFDLERTLAWHEPLECYADSAATKAEQCLREVFQLQPQTDLCRYHVRPCPRDVELVARFVRSLEESTPGRRGFMLVHYQGNSARRYKNLPEDAIAKACRTARQLGYIPVLLDWDRRNKLAKRGDAELVVLAAEHWLWSGRGIGNAGTIAALADQAALCLGIDSGPGHIFAARKTPTIIVWTWHHPLHYFPPTENVTHLLPVDHGRLLRGRNTRAGAEFFEANYSRRCYSRLHLALPRLVEEKLAQRGETSAAAPRNTLEMHGDLWARRAAPTDIAEITRDYLHDSKEPRDRRPRVVLDLAAGIGAYVAALHERSQRTTALCWNPDPAATTVLKSNVGDFAEVAAASFAVNQLLPPMRSWLESQSAPLGLLRYDPMCPTSTKLAQELAGAMRPKPAAGIS